MNVLKDLIIAPRLQTAIILRVLLTVIVKQDTSEMDIIAQVDAILHTCGILNLCK